MSNSMSLPIQVCQLPEIAVEIASYLDARDIRNGSAVCKSWRSSFLPYLWEYTHLGYLTNDLFRGTLHHFPQSTLIHLVNTESGDLKSSLATQSPIDSLERYSGWIQNLSIYFVKTLKSVKEIGENFSSVTSLHVIDTFSDARSIGSLKFKRLLLRNRVSLQTLNVEFHSPTKIPVPQVRLWNPILNCTEHLNLRSLTMSNTDIHGGHLKAFWEVCSRLEELELSKVSFNVVYVPAHACRNSNSTIQSSSDPTKSMVTRFPRLRRFTLKEMARVKPYQQLNLLICHCPLIRSLCWMLRSNNQIPIDKFSGYLLGSTWPELEYTHVYGHNDWVDPKQYHHLLQNIKRPLKALDLQVRGFGFSPQTFDIMRKHDFQTLTRVDIRMVNADTNGEWAQEMLESCIMLEYIRYTRISLETIASGKPWICLGLKEFHILIDMPPGIVDTSIQYEPRVVVNETTTEECRVVYSQLSRLRKLRVIDMSCPKWSRVNYSPLPFKLDLGLGLLSMLSEIETLELMGAQDMRRVDIEWILDHWKGLKTIIIEKLSDKRSKPGGLYLRNHWLKKRLEDRGVVVLPGNNIAVAEMDQYDSSSDENE